MGDSARAWPYLVTVGLTFAGAVIGGAIGYAMEADSCHEPNIFGHIGCVQSFVGALIGFFGGLALGLLLVLIARQQRRRGGG
jgi:hypothetical protein